MEEKQEELVPESTADPAADPSSSGQLLVGSGGGYTSFSPNDEDTKNAEDSRPMDRAQNMPSHPHRAPSTLRPSVRIKRSAKSRPKLPKTMKAVVCVRNGPPDEVLQFKDIPLPPIAKPHHVLVKVLCASMNFIDYKIITGMMGSVSPKKAPFIAGTDFSGRLIAKGRAANLKHIRVGDLVYGQCWRGHQGSFAEYLVCRGKNVQRMPRSMSPLHAAAMPLVSQTSYQAIQRLKLKARDKLLILGGSTATGLIAIQIAKHCIECCEVIVTSTQQELCRSLGADRVINYREEQWSKVLENYNVDAIYDCVGGQDSWDLARSQHVLKMDGRYCTIVGDQIHGEELTVGNILGTGLSLMNRKFWGAVGHQKYDFVMADSSRNLKDITALIDGGKVRAVLDPSSPFRLEEYLKVFEKCAVHSARGKLVLHIADDEDTEDEEESVVVVDDAKEEEKGRESVGGGDAGNNPFIMLHDDSFQEASALDEEQYQRYEREEDGDDEKVEETKIEEEEDVEVVDSLNNEAEAVEHGVAAATTEAVSEPKTKGVEVIEESEDEEENDEDHTADIAEKQEMAHDHAANAVF